MEVGNTSRLQHLDQFLWDAVMSADRAIPRSLPLRIATVPLRCCRVWRQSYTKITSTAHCNSTFEVLSCLETELYQDHFHCALQQFLWDAVVSGDRAIPRSLPLRIATVPLRCCRVWRQSYTKITSTAHCNSSCEMLSCLETELYQDHFHCALQQFLWDAVVSADRAIPRSLPLLLATVPLRCCRVWRQSYTTITSTAHCNSSFEMLSCLETELYQDHFHCALQQFLWDAVVSGDRAIPRSLPLPIATVPVRCCRVWRQSYTKITSTAHCNSSCEMLSCLETELYQDHFPCALQQFLWDAVVSGDRAIPRSLPLPIATVPVRCCRVCRQSYTKITSFSVFLPDWLLAGLSRLWMFATHIHVCMFCVATNRHAHTAVCSGMGASNEASR